MYIDTCTMYIECLSSWRRQVNKSTCFGCWQERIAGQCWPITIATTITPLSIYVPLHRNYNEQLISHNMTNNKRENTSIKYLIIALRYYLDRSLTSMKNSSLYFSLIFLIIDYISSVNYKFNVERIILNRNFIY